MKLYLKKDYILPFKSFLYKFFKGYFEKYLFELAH